MAFMIVYQQKRPAWSLENWREAGNYYELWHTHGWRPEQEQLPRILTNAFLYLTHCEVKNEWSRKKQLTRVVLKMAKVFDLPDALINRCRDVVADHINTGDERVQQTAIDLVVKMMKHDYSVEKLEIEKAEIEERRRLGDIDRVDAECRLELLKMIADNNADKAGTGTEAVQDTDADRDGGDDHAELHPG